MKRIALGLSAALCLIGFNATAGATPAWTNAAAGMGQFEGGITLDGNAAGIRYSCSGLGTNVSFWAKGAHVAAGKSQLLIDGKAVEIDRPDAVYSSMNDQTVFELNVKADYGARWKSEINHVIAALAGGKEAVWISSNGDRFTFPLTGSAKISSCKM